MFIKQSIFLFFAATIIAGCDAPIATLKPTVNSNPAATILQDQNRLENKIKTMPESGKAMVKFLGTNAKAAKDFLTNTTVRAFSHSHGTEIEYLASNGKAFLLYPGNTALVDGKWDVRQTGPLAQICFQYQSNSINPITQRRGGDWECTLMVVYLAQSENIVQGDVLKMASSDLTFVLPKGNLSLIQAQKMAGQSGNMVEKKNW